MSSPVTLKRTLSLPSLVLYGLGTTIGAGIYALIGELVKVSGYLAPASFLFASFMAALTAMSFAELSARYPQAAGAAVYVKKGINSESLSLVVGLLVIFAGLISAAALTNAFSGYLNQLFELNRELSIVCIVLVLCIVAMWGIVESVLVATLVTVIEVGGLIMVIYVSYSGLHNITDKIGLLIPTFEVASFMGIGSGALLAFYAFIGFEDMVVVAEEVKEVKTTLPYAILITLGVTTILYIMIMVAAVIGLPVEELANSKAPLVFMYEYFSGRNGSVIGLIGMLAIINGALIQIIMASRVMYGLSFRRQLPIIFSRVNSFTRTPLIATGLAAIIVLLLALIGRLGSLAEATSIIMLLVFSLVNLSLWRIKVKEVPPEDIIHFPIWVPVLGFFVSFGFVIYELMKLLFTSV
jgi:amino acid transporter